MRAEGWDPDNSAGDRGPMVAASQILGGDLKISDQNNWGGGE